MNQSERQFVTFSEESRASNLTLTLRRNEVLWERLLETHMDALWTQIMLVPVLQGSQSFLQMRQALHHSRESPTHELSNVEGSMKGLLSVVLVGDCFPLVA